MLAAVEKLVVWLSGEVKSPPLSKDARLHTGFLLRRPQRGERLVMPAARPMPDIGRGCHELRIDDGGRAWRLVYAIQPDAIVVLEVFEKKTQKTPMHVLASCRERLERYRRVIREGGRK